MNYVSTLTSVGLFVLHDLLVSSRQRLTYQTSYCDPFYRRMYGITNFICE